MAETHELPTLPDKKLKEEVRPAVIPAAGLKQFLKLPPARFLLIGILSFLVAVLFLASTVAKKTQPEELPEPTAGVAPPFPVGLGQPSEYAQDPSLLIIEGQVSGLETELETVDLREPTLTPPLIDLKVSFE